MRGDEALVVMIVDQLCVDRVCVSNADSSGSLPKNGDQFTAAFNASQLGNVTMPAVRIAKKWYLTTT